jgi:hypothetical protein
VTALDALDEAVARATACRLDRRGDVHTMPAGGPEHDCSAACWCGPYADSSGVAGMVWIHRAEDEAA